jgi:hypothetical protein
VAKHGPNVLRFVLRTGNSSYAMVGLYSPPTDDGAELENVQKALDASPWGIPLLVLGDLNADLELMRGP